MSQVIGEEEEYIDEPDLSAAGYETSSGGSASGNEGCVRAVRTGIDGKAGEGVTG